MLMDRERSMINDHHNDIIFFNGTHLNLFEYSLDKKWNLEVNFKASISNPSDSKFYFGISITNDLILEQWEDKMSILSLDDLKQFEFTRYLIGKDACGRPMHKSESHKLTNKTDQMSSLLFALCNVAMSNTFMYTLLKDENNLKILKYRVSSESMVTLAAQPSSTQFVDYGWYSLKMTATQRKKVPQVR